MSKSLVCRGCLAVPGKSASALDSSASEAYKTLIGVPVTQVEGFPEHLCCLCRRQLRRCVQFRVRCLLVLEILRQAQPQMITNEYTNWLRSSYPELKQQYVQTKTLTVEFDSSSVNIFKHETRGDSYNNEDPIGFAKEEKLSDSELNTEVIDEHLPDNDLGVKTNDCNIDVLKPYEVYVKDYNVFENEKDEKLKKADLKTIRTVKSKRKKNLKSDTQIVKDYAKSAGFDITFLSRAEQIQEIEQKKSESLANGINCRECGKVFRDSVVFERHVKHYHVMKPSSFMCDICSCVFHNKRALRAHVTGHSWVFTCQTCNFRTKQRAVLRKHQNYHKGRMFKCKYCAKVFDKHATYFSHVRLLHAAELPSCDLCGEFFNSDKGVDTHKKLSHNLAEDFPNACSNCDKRFKSDAALEWHIRVKGCNLPSCAQCGDSFIIDDVLKHHLVQRHYAKTTPETFDCDQCAIRFYNAKALARHACDSKAVCIQCGDHFESTQLLSEHFSSSHHIFKCEECSKQFTNAMYFKRHYALCHTEPPTDPQAKPRQSKARKYPLQTTVRKWSVVGAADLRMERLVGDADQRTNDVSKPAVMCEVCGKYVKNKSDLKYHQQTSHSDDHRFSCSHCHKRFKRKDLLQTHERVHTGERPYACARCPKAFKTYPACRRHQLVHTGERSHVCSECGKAFQLSTSVKWHIRTAHLHLPWPKRGRRAQPKHDPDMSNKVEFNN